MDSETHFDQLIPGAEEKEKRSEIAFRGKEGGQAEKEKRAELADRSLGLLQRLKQHHSLLSNAERQIGEYVLTHSQQTLNLPIDQLAREIGVGMSTLSQFCQTLGYKGFKNFKLDLAAELKTPFEMDRSIITAGDSLEEITRKALSASVDALLNTHKGLDQSELKRALKAIREAQRIDLYGFGVSSVVGLDAYNRFLSLGLHVNWLPDIAHQAISATVLKQGDVAIAFSYSGENELTAQTFKKVRQAGAITIAITGNRASSTALHADIVLQIFSTEPTPFVSNLYTSGRMAMLSVVDMLCLGLLYSSEQTLDQLEQIGGAMEQLTRSLEG